MNKESLTNLLNQLKNGQIEVNEAIDKLNILPFQDLGFAKIDHHRSLRTGYSEVIFCQGKTHEQVEKIYMSLSNLEY